MDPQDTGAAAAKPLGRMLAEERERQGLSRLDIAQRLHMSAYQVEAIEAGDYTRLPQGTFLRGFVRNYAKILGIAPDSVLPLLAESAPGAKRPGIVVPTQNIRFDPLGQRLANPYVKAGLLAFVAISVGFTAMYWWLFIRPTPPGAARHATTESPTQQPAPSEPASTPAVVASTPIVTPPPAATIEPPKPATNAAVAPPKAGPQSPPVAPPAPVPAAEPAKQAPEKTVVAAGTGGTLKFRFHGDSWVEIRDRRGKVILSKLNVAGSEAEVSGQPPFNVVVGNAPEVELFYNNQEFDLEPHTKVAVARFTVE